MYVYSFISGCLSTHVVQVSGSSSGRSSQYGHSWMRSAVQSCHNAERTSSRPHDELKWYMESPLEDVADVIVWWGVRDHRMVSSTITNAIVASHHAVSDTLEDGKRLSCYPRVCNSFGTCILKWWYHWHCQA